MIKAASTGKQFRIHLVELEDGRVVNVGFKQTYAIGDTFDAMCEFKFGEWKPTASGSSSAPARSEAPATPPKKAWVDKTFPVPTTHGDMAIIRQNALTNAVNYYNANVGMPSGLAAEEAIESIIKMAYKFAEFSSGHREVRIERELAGKRGKAGSSE
jgi:hypothetical protein